MKSALQKIEEEFDEYDIEERSKCCGYRVKVKFYSNFCLKCKKPCKIILVNNKKEECV